jgi:hypothetical protein
MIPTHWKHVAVDPDRHLGERSMPRPWWVYTVVFIIAPAVQARRFLMRWWPVVAVFAIGYLLGRLR